MTTEVQNILPIPSSVVVGSGSYTIPANKYAHFQANTSCTTMGWLGNSSGYNSTSNISNTAPAISQNASASANSCSQWVTAGTSITISATNNTSQILASTTSAIQTANYSDNFNAVRLNGVSVCISKSSGGASIFNNFSQTRYVGSRSSGNHNWSASIYDTPINNLPTELIVS